MNTQTVFQVGNSHVVSIPKHLMKDLSLKSGQKVIVEKVGENELIIRRQPSKRSQSKKTSILSDREFKTWLTQFLERDGEILDELATR